MRYVDPREVESLHGTVYSNDRQGVRLLNDRRETPKLLIASETAVVEQDIRCQTYQPVHVKGGQDPRK